MIKQPQRQQQRQHRYPQVRPQLVDLVQHLQEDSAVPKQQQQPHHQAAAQHLALRQQQEDSGQRPAVLVVQDLERVRLGQRQQQADSAVLQAALEAHLASVARREDSAGE